MKLPTLKGNTALINKRRRKKARVRYGLSRFNKVAGKQVNLVPLFGGQKNPGLVNVHVHVLQFIHC